MILMNSNWLKTIFLLLFIVLFVRSEEAAQQKQAQTQESYQKPNKEEDEIKNKLI